LGEIIYGKESKEMSSLCAGVDITEIIEALWSTHHAKNFRLYSSLAWIEKYYDDISRHISLAMNDLWNEQTFCESSTHKQERRHLDVDISTRKKKDTSITLCQLNATANTDDTPADSKSTKLFEMSTKHY
jgi:hypothetical protein